MICGLLGEKLGHSYSPQIHKNLGNYSYSLYEKTPEELDAFLTSGDFHGLNVTIPYKKSVLKYCNRLSPEAEKLGAANTIVRQDDGTLIGHNTDYYGFRYMATRIQMDYTGKKVLVLGSGGASNTVCAVMEELGANPVVISRNGENNYKNLHRHSDCAVIINATPVGMYPNTGISPIELDHFSHLEYVMDLIYNPGKTKLLLDAEIRGIPTANGLWMLVAQAAESSHWFTGEPFDPDSIPRIYKQLKMQMQNIVLIGMPGCGKSTIGKTLAQKLGKDFADSDAEIESAAGCAIAEIFRTRGEAYFRQLETAALANLAKRSACVIATGGGCVTQKENFSILRQNATILWIKRDLSALPTEGRPLSQTTALEQMYQLREPLYRTFAHGAIENNATVEEASEKIIRLLEEMI